MLDSMIRAPVLGYFTVVLLACGAMPAAGAGKALGAAEVFSLALPEWNPDLEELPPEFRPLHVVRPELPEGVASDIAQIETRITQVESSWLHAEGIEEQNALLEEGIELAKRAMAMRRKYQGNTEATVRWRDMTGEPSEWYEVADAQLRIETLYLFRNLEQDSRSKLVSVKNLDSKIIQFYQEGLFEEALSETQNQFRVYMDVFGEQHPDTIASIGNIGVMLRNLGRAKEAENHTRKSLALRRQILGNDHPDTVGSINNLGVLLRDLGNLQESEQMYREAAIGFGRVLGSRHRRTLNAFNNLAVVLEQIGRLSEAESLNNYVLKIRSATLGPDHYETQQSIGNQANISLLLGKINNAESLGLRAYFGRRDSLGYLHPSTLESVHFMGYLRSFQGRHIESEQYFREAYAGYVNLFGKEHRSTLLSEMGLAYSLVSQNRLNEAEKLYRSSLEGFRNTMGQNHYDTLISSANLGYLLTHKGDFAEAETYLLDSMNSFFQIFGGDHPRTQASIHNVAFLYAMQGRLVDAGPLYLNVVQGRRNLLGDTHPDTIASVRGLAVVFRMQGRLIESEVLFAESLSAAERLRLGVSGQASERAQFADILDLAGIAADFARALIELGRDEEGLSILERGRGRAGLDMFAGGRTAADEALRETADAARLARYNAALAAEEVARLAVFESEARLAAAPEADKPARREVMLAARRTMSEKTAAVFAELRGLVPAVDPMTSEQMLAALRPGEAVLTWSWTSDGVIALVARDGEVRGVTLAGDRDEAGALTETLGSLRAAIAARPSGGEAISPAELATARRAAVPDELRAMLSDVSSVIAVTDGPLAGIPVELLLPEVPVSYAPSATIALRPRLGASAPTTAIASSAGVVVGDPVFAGMDQDEPDYPQAGILLAMVADDSNAAVAGLARGDVLLSYGGHELAGPEDLGPAIGATAEALTSRGVSDTDRPIAARVWRDGQEIEVALAPGRMGVQMDQRPPADGLRSMATFDRSADELAANANALEQIRFYGGSLSRLPATRLEAETVAALLGDDATLLLGADATAPRLREAVESSPPRVLHLATHGLLGSADRPLLASLALTTPDEPTGEDTGFVTLGDILATWGGQLRGTELVVLSACDTATAVRQGDTMMALPLGLLVSGADSVLASLWKVDDRATALLMARFYANWLGKTESGREIDGTEYVAGEALPKLAALREAQAWLRDLTAEQVRTLTGATAGQIATETSRGPSPRRGRLAAGQDPDARPYEHPYYWAAFTMHGEID